MKSTGDKQNNYFSMKMVIFVATAKEVNLHEQLAATSQQFIAELNSSLNGIKVSFIEALLPKCIFHFKQAHFVYFKSV